MAMEGSKSSQRWGIVVVGLAFLMAVGPLIVEPMSQRIRVSLMPERERDESSGLLQLFRSLQMSLADICYAKSTHYQHRGILYQIEGEDILGEEINREQNNLTDKADEATSPVVVPLQPDDRRGPGLAAADHHNHTHKDLTEIPSPENDFRGIIGDVERAVKPFDTSHVEHVKPIEALPWLRLATWINPEHENAWVATAFWLKRTERQNPQATAQAIALLERALAVNPPRKGQPYEKQGLVYMLGYLYLFPGNNAQKALEVLEPVLKRGEEDFAQLDEVQRDWLSFNFRNAIQACRKLKQHEKAIEICKRAIALFPEDKPLQKTLRREQQLLKKIREAKPANAGKQTGR